MCPSASSSGRTAEFVPVENLLRGIIDAMGFTRGYDDQLYRASLAILDILEFDYCILRYGRDGKVLFVGDLNQNLIWVPNAAFDVDDHLTERHSKILDQIEVIDEEFSISDAVSGRLLGWMVRCEEPHDRNPIPQFENTPMRYTFFGVNAVARERMEIDTFEKLDKIKTDSSLSVCPKSYCII